VAPYGHFIHLYIPSPLLFPKLDGHSFPNMKITPFKKLDVVENVSSRESIRLEGIPFIWSSNLSDEQLREIYTRLLRDRFFLRKPDVGMNKLTMGMAVKLRANLREAQFEYEDGLCQVYCFHDHIWVIYRTAEQWEAWARVVKKQQEAKRKFQEDKQGLRDKHSELQSRAAYLIDAGKLKEAEECLLEGHRLFLKHMVVIRHSDAKSRLIKIYGRYKDPSNGLAFLDNIPFDDHDYYLLAQEFREDPVKVEAVFKEGIKRSQDPGNLYKRLCLYFQEKSLFDKAIYYCGKAIAKGLRDDTKSGFPGRLERLRKHNGDVAGQGSKK